MKKRFLILCLIGALMTSSIMTGCVKIVKVGEEAQLTQDSSSKATDISAKWESDIAPELKEKAVDIVSLLTEAKGDISSVGSKYAKKSQGTDGKLNFTVKGTGTVESVNTESRAGYIQIKLSGYTGQETIKIQAGPVFKGTSVRDSSNVIKLDDYKNQVDYAAVSTNINNKILQTTLKDLDVASLKGKQIDFIGCFTLDKSSELLITPIEIKVK